MTDKFIITIIRCDGSILQLPEEEVEIYNMGEDSYDVEILETNEVIEVRRGGFIN